MNDSLYIVADKVPWQRVSLMELDGGIAVTVFDVRNDAVY